MILPRRQFLHLAAGAAALPALSRFAWAQAYPVRPIMIVDTFPPGGSTGIIARIIADKFSETLGQQVIVDQRAGAGGTVAAKQIARSTPDGYTIMLGFTGTLGIAPSLYPNVGYDPRARILRPSAGLAWHRTRWWSTLLFQSAQSLN
jgi:tripartite-type tricarboxylate transporter receptor subunit TctC